MNNFASADEASKRPQPVKNEINKQMREPAESAAGGAANQIACVAGFI
jgi:hypothetical protein